MHLAYMRPNLNYYSTDGDSPFVFQHGLTADVAQVQRFFAEKHEWKIMSIDCPGHGKSPLTPGYKPSFKVYAEEVIRFLDSQVVERAVFGGISMGSGIALHIGLNFPDRVKGLVLVRPAWLDKSNPENLLILRRAADCMECENGKAMFCEDEEFKHIQATLPSAAQSILGVFAEHQQEVLPKVIHAMAADRPFESMSHLQEIEAPCLIIANDDDPLHPYSMAKKISECISHSILKKVTSRYIDNELHSQEVLAHISHFLKEKAEKNEELLG